MSFMVEGVYTLFLPFLIDFVIYKECIDFKIYKKIHMFNLDISLSWPTHIVDTTTHSNYTNKKFAKYIYVVN
jgi:hypothetical protein